MIGFLRKNNNNVAALTNNSASDAGQISSADSSIAHKVIHDSSSESGASNDGSNQDISNRQQRDGSGSGRGPVNASQKVPGLSLLQFGGIGGAGLGLSHRSKKAALRSRNGGLMPNFATQTSEGNSSSEDLKQPSAIPASAGGLLASQRGSAAFEGGAADITGGMASFNNARGTFRKRMNVLNNDGLSLREK